jgi:hypothetical protein
MSWWKKTLLASLIWFIAVVAMGYVHTSIILAGRITEPQDEAISEMYGFAFGVGLMMLWAVAVVIVLLRSGGDKAPTR